MTIRWRASDNAPRSGGCAACGEIETDGSTGNLRGQSAVGSLPGKPDWPLLGCMYRSTDGQGGPFGVGRSAAGLLGMKGTSGYPSDFDWLPG